MRLFLFGFVSFFWSVGALYAQEGSAQRFFMQGDSLRCNYRFEEAIEAYRLAAMASSDTLFRNRAELNMIWCENGLNMLQYAVDLQALGSAIIDREQFYLYLSIDPNSFWAIPPAGFPEISPAYPAFVSTANQTILFTGKSNGSNHLDLFISRQLNDTLWSYPQLMESTVNSAGNECYPVLSADGRTIWFASDGHYGMGGFDLYVSHFDEDSGTWSQARNVGFPYSSINNDLAFMPAPDGLSALIVSDRGGDVALLNIYKVAFEMNPERYDWRDRLDLPLLVQLQYDVLPSMREVNNVTASQSGMNDYMLLVQSAKKIRDQVTDQEKKLAGSRETYTRLLQEEERLTLVRRIEEEEKLLIELREKYRLAGEAVQKAEMEFLIKGIIPAFEPDPIQKGLSDAEPIPFVPQQGRLGEIDTFMFAAPILIEKQVDYAFRIGEISEIIVEEAFPDYLFYRVQLAVLSAPTSPLTFKGISPIFEQYTAAGKYLYTAGHFGSYAEASKALQNVQQHGFKSAILVGFHQGKSVPIASARKLESTVQTLSYRVSLGVYRQGLPATLLASVKELSNKDLARVMGDGGLRYVVGPFGTLKEAQKLQEDLLDMGFEEIIVEVINP